MYDAIAEIHIAIGQRTDDAVHPAGEYDEHQDDEAVARIEVFKFPGKLSGQHGGDDLRAIERRYRDQIEESEPYIVHHDPLQEIEAAVTEHADTPQDRDEKQRKECQEKIHARACEGYLQHPHAIIFIIAWIDVYRLRPAESAEYEKESPHHIEMRHRIDGQPPHARRGGITHGIRHGRMRVLVHRECDQKRRSAVDQGRQIKKIKHKSSLKKQVQG